MLITCLSTFILGNIRYNMYITLHDIALHQYGMIKRFVELLEPNGSRANMNNEITNKCASFVCVHIIMMMNV